MGFSDCLEAETPGVMAPDDAVPSVQSSDPKATCAFSPLQCSWKRIETKGAAKLVLLTLRNQVASQLRS